MSYDRVITSKDMMKIEEKADSMGVTRLLMMENAGAGVAYNLLRYYESNGKSIRGSRIAVVCGVGNNGGDAMVAARHLTYYGADIRVVLPSDNVKTEEARINYRILTGMKSIKMIVNDLRASIDTIMGSDVIIDGIFGTGIKGSIREPYASVIDAINRAPAYRVAVDIPSGLDPDTGYADICVNADLTVTFHMMKRGLVIDAGKNSGTVIVWNIGIPPDAEENI